MSENYTTQIWGVLPDEGNPLADAVEPWLDLLEFPTAENGRNMYPYNVRDAEGNVNRETTSDRSTLDRIVTNAERFTFKTTGISGQTGKAIQYGDLRLEVTLWSESAGWPMGPVFCIELPTRTLTEDSSDTGRVEVKLLQQLLELTSESHTRTDAVYSYGNSVIGARQMEDHPQRAVIEAADVGQLETEWLLVLPPAVVEKIGREPLWNAPVWHIEEIDNGAVLVVVDKDPRWEAPQRPLPIRAFFAENE